MTSRGYNIIGVSAAHSGARRVIVDSFSEWEDAINTAFAVVASGVYSYVLVKNMETGAIAFDSSDSAQPIDGRK